MPNTEPNSSEINSAEPESEENHSNEGSAEEGHSGEETAGEETAGEETAGEETAGEDTPGEDTPGEDMPGEDTTGEDMPGEDTTGEETAGEETAGEETAGEDATSEDATGDGPSENGDANDGDDEIAGGDDVEQLNSSTVKMVLEAALLSSSEPLTVQTLRRMFKAEASMETIRNLLESIREDWKDRGIELVNIASGWRFQTRPEFRNYLDRIAPEKAPKYSRAVMETLAIISYRQPVTRGDIENIRGVTVSAGIIRALEARSWIDTVGYRDVPGRPALYATTKTFLDDLGLRSLQELPPLEEIATTLELTQTQTSTEPAAQTGETETGDFESGYSESGESESGESEPESSPAA